MTKPRRADLTSLYLRYMSSIRTTANKKTCLDTMTHIERFLSRFEDGKHNFPEDFHRWEIEEYRDIRLREGVNPTSLVTELGKVRALWNWLIDRELAVSSPLEKLKVERAKPLRTEDIYTDEALRKLWAECRSDREKIIFLLPLLCGVKLYELCRFRGELVNFEKALLGDRPIREDLLALLPRKGYLLGGAKEKLVNDLWRGVTVRAGVPCLPINKLANSYKRILARGGVSKEERDSEKIRPMLRVFPV